MAKPFIEAVQEAGIDIMEKQNFVRFSAGRCERQHVTLVDRAVAFGNTGYAKMVLELAKAQPEGQRELPKTLPFQTATPSSPPLSGSRIVQPASTCANSQPLTGR